MLVLKGCIGLGCTGPAGERGHSRWQRRFRRSSWREEALAGGWGAAYRASIHGALQHACHDDLPACFKHACSLTA